jgi:hypothetical protein
MNGTHLGDGVWEDRDVSRASGGNAMDTRGIEAPGFRVEPLNVGSSRVAEEETDLLGAVQAVHEVLRTFLEP